MSPPRTGRLYVLFADDAARTAAPSALSAVVAALGADAVHQNDDDPLGGAGDKDALLALDAGDAVLALASETEAVDRLADAAASLQQTRRVRYALAPLGDARVSDAAAAAFGDALVAGAPSSPVDAPNEGALGAAARDALDAAEAAGRAAGRTERAAAIREAGWRERCALRAAGDDVGALARHIARYPDTAPFALARFDSQLELLIGGENARRLHDDALAAAADLPPGVAADALVAPLAARSGRSPATLWRDGARRRRLASARFPVLVDHLPELRKVLIYLSVAVTLIISAAWFFG